MGSYPLPQFLPLEPSLTFQPTEIDYLFYGGPPLARRHAPQVAVAVELQRANSAASLPSSTPASQAPHSGDQGPGDRIDHDHSNHRHRSYNFEGSTHDVFNFDIHQQYAVENQICSFDELYHEVENGSVEGQECSECFVLSPSYALKHRRTQRWRTLSFVRATTTQPHSLSTRIEDYTSLKHRQVCGTIFGGLGVEEKRYFGAPIVMAPSCDEKLGGRGLQKLRIVLNLLLAKRTVTSVNLVMALNLGKPARP